MSLPVGLFLKEKRTWLFLRKVGYKGKENMLLLFLECVFV